MPFNPPTPVAPLPRGMQPVTPVLSQRGVFLPTVGGGINVSLEGEIVRCEAIEILGPDAIVVKISSLVVDKSNHGFKRGSMIACRREFNGMQEIWTPISEREVREREAIERARALVAPPEAEMEQAPQAAVVAPPVAEPAAVGPAPKRALGPRRSKVARAA